MRSMYGSADVCSSDLEKGVEAGCPFPEGQVQDILDTSFLDPAVQEKPYPYYRALRATSSIRYSDSMGMYLVSRHDDLQTILRDPITFSQELGYYKQMANGHLDEMKEILEREGGGFFPDVVNIDPPRHTQIGRTSWRERVVKDV